MFAYAEAERILARLHGADDETAQRGAFRARLKHLKRLGIPLGVSPGRGKRVEYEYEHLFQWAFCLELAEFGVDPTVTAELIAKRWKDQIWPSCQSMLVGSGTESKIFYFQPKLMAMAWLEAGVDFPAFYSFGIAERRDVDLVLGQRAMIIDLSELQRLIGLQIQGVGPN